MNNKYQIGDIIKIKLNDIFLIMRLLEQCSEHEFKFEMIKTNIPGRVDTSTIPSWNFSEGEMAGIILKKPEYFNEKNI